MVDAMFRLLTAATNMIGLLILLVGVLTLLKAVITREGPLGYAAAGLIILIGDYVAGIFPHGAH